MNRRKSIPDPIIIPLQSIAGQSEPTRLIRTSQPAELRKLRVDEFLQARSLAPKSQHVFYVYDFGDEWVHQITVEKILPMQSEQPYPTCLAGKRACPPEDYGGSWGYAALLKILKNPRHREYRERKEWVGRKFSPEAFDFKEVNEQLKEFDYLSPL
ncbi:plasmid pRiA4b ORF-3 family protein [Leptolyngbya sp. Cla-17]|uniref:plasmid pRiA4b ORF-3 family protein n=1 Tax=Leptolyngbya sp. Cla-17 TaxID=2803751 RepID=UPI001F5E2636|nr:plasmid pRiA4b ORF-3 family protein [Leptolyngbya sp. Cla-17]